MMPLTTKGRYAGRIMVQLAGEREGNLLTKYDIGRREGISANYVEQIMILLRASNLVKSHRGRRGGFSLMRDPKTITLADVLHAVEGPVAPAPCLKQHCERDATCSTRPVWKKAAKAVEQILEETTIADLAVDAGHQRAESLSYQI